MLSVEVKQTRPNYSYDLKTVIKELTSKKVVAGFPKGKLNTPYYEFKWNRRKERNKNKPSIIDVAVKNNFGIGVPRREFMAEAAKQWQKIWNEKMDKINDGMVKGHMDVDKFLDVIGQEGASIISKTIRDWTTPPNSAFTIAMKGVNNPLVDSSAMKNAPRHEIRENK